MIDIYLDCADLEQIREGVKNTLVKGVTTNPTLMAKAGVTDYERFAKDALQIVEGLPISLEVFSDDFSDMERQARKIASWGPNVNVKIPITATDGAYATSLISRLSSDGISCNVTAVFTLPQIYRIANALDSRNPVAHSIISIFAGRIADTSIDPIPLLREIVYIAKTRPDIKILWASCREVLNIYQAEECGCHIITVTPDLLKKYDTLRGKDLTEYSLETVSMFYDDAKKAGFQL